MPEDDADGDADIERMLRAPLGDFQREIGCIYDALLHAVHFVSENERVTIARNGLEIIKFDGVDSLFDRYHGIALSLEGLYRILCFGIMLPVDAVLCPEGGLVDLCRRWYGAYAAEDDSVRLEGVGCTKCGPDVMGAADIVEYYDDAGFRKFLVFYS